MRPLLTAFAIFVFSGFVVAEEIRPGVMRTPDSQFENLKGFDFSPNYLEIGELRIHYVDEGPKMESRYFCCMASQHGAIYSVI